MASRVRKLLTVLDQVVTVPEDMLTEEVRTERLKIYQDANDAMRSALGKFGRLPLGFPPDWSMNRLSGPDYRDAIARRAGMFALTTLLDVDVVKDA